MVPPTRPTLKPCLPTSRQGGREVGRQRKGGGTDTAGRTERAEAEVPQRPAQRLAAVVRRDDTDGWQSQSRRVSLLGHFQQRLACPLGPLTTSRRAILVKARAQQPAQTTKAVSEVGDRRQQRHPPRHPEHTGCKQPGRAKP